MFGAVWVTQAALPIMREQGSGHILQVSSIGGVGAFTDTGIYHGSKWALEGISESLAQEVEPFGIHVTLIEPGGYSTDWAGSSARHAEAIEAYQPMHDKPRAAAAKRGDPDATGDAILAVVDADTPPLRLLLGEGPTQLVKTLYADRLATWAQWEDVSKAAQGN